LIASRQRTKLLTFESWVTRREWFSYAWRNPDCVPFPLVDRSPCQEPFFDPYAPSPQLRRPLITGLCRCLRNFQPGDRYLYITRIDPRVCDDLGIRVAAGQPHYFGVAALVVGRVWESHAEAAATFRPRRYVVAPALTSYPPDLAHERKPTAAVARENCIVHDASKKAHTPLESDEALWRHAYLAYHLRQRDRSLRAAECRIERVGGAEALKLTPESAPIFTPLDWGGVTMTMGGHWITEAQADELRAGIAEAPGEIRPAGSLTGSASRLPRQSPLADGLL
jgi:hypothetical protein